MFLSSEYWNTRYVENDFGWDAGEITTPLKTYFDQLKDKSLKILIPGAGNSYEAEYLFNKDKNYIQFFANLKFKNNTFYISPTREKWEQTIDMFLNECIMANLSN